MTEPKPPTATPAVKTTDTAPATVALCLLDGVDFSALNHLCSTLFLHEQLWVTLDCTRLEHLGPAEVQTLARFTSQFAWHGGSLRLTNVNSRLSSLFSVLGAQALVETKPPQEAQA